MLLHELEIRSMSLKNDSLAVEQYVSQQRKL